LLFTFQINAQTPGVSTFYEQFSGDTREYIEYIPGNLPIIISAPHGGVKQSGSTVGGTFYPDNDSTLPDRSCGTNERDDNTDILIREIQAEIFALTGCYAHVIINNLHRSKLDPNREATEATCGDSDSLDHWNAWHSFIDQASTSVNTNWGKGLYIDLHGQSHTIPRIEIGYNITATELNTGNLNSTTNINRSTIKSLVSTNLNSLTHEQLIRGTNSLGELFQNVPAVFYNANVNPQCGVTSGYRAVPSASDYGNTSCDDTRPYTNAYFNGDFYNNRRHGSGNGSGTNAGSDDGGGTIDGIMTEVNRRVRDLGTYNGNVYDTRPQTLVPFAKEYAEVVLDYIDIHYNDFASFSYLANSYDINVSDPSPTITGLSGGTFSSTSGLSINVNTGVIDLSASSTGNYVVTYTVGTCGYYSDTFNIEITGVLPDTEAPTAPSNLASGSITLTTIDLSWDGSTDNVGVTGYEIYQDGNLITTVATTSYQVTGLSNGTSYSYYIIAKDAANNSSAQSNTINPSTLVPDSQAPTAPTNLATSNIAATSVDLSWDASTDNVGVTDYEVYQDGNLIATIATTTYQVTGLTNATSYAFYVIAKDAVGNSSTQSNTVNIDTQDNESPTAPANLVSSNITAISVDLSWDASTDNVGVTDYEVYQDGNLIATVATTTYQVTGLTNGTSYAFYVITRDAANNSSAQSNTIDVNTLDTEDPTAPTNLVASNITVTTVDLNWTAASDNVGVTGYDVYQDGNLISTVGTTSYQVTGLSASTSYSFYIIARDAVGNSSVQSNTVSITTADPIACSGTVVSSFPYSETFDSSIGDWMQAGGDDGDWVLDANATPSGGTGPSDDITEGGNYFFLEASSNNSPGEIGANATAILESPCFDLTTITSGTFSFYYHMFGTALGSLNLEITSDDGANWINIFSVSGNIGNEWNLQNIDLSSYIGQTVKLRFIGLTGNGWSSDIAIDQIAIGEPIIPDYCLSNGNDTSDEYIGRVQLNTLDNNNSGVGTTSTGYSDFTGNPALTTDLLGGSTYTITVTPVWPGNSFNEGYAVWIDYNRDGDFLDLGEQVWSQAITQTTPVSGTFIIPNTISYGETRMRVALKYNGVPTACESFDFGEVEDYTINLMYDGLLFKNNVWTPNGPSDTTASEDALIFDGTYTEHSTVT
jgi:chitodextrinase